MSQQKQARSGISFLSVLGIVFLILKLTHVINWSWWLVLLPFYLPGMVMAVLLLGFIVALVVVAFKK